MNVNDEVKNRAINTVYSILRRTGHVPIVSNIARCAGFCYYYARLSEAIGVRNLHGHLVDRISGKGDIVHKVLGMASLKIFMRSKIPDKDFIRKSVDEAVKMLQSSRLIASDKDINNVKNQASTMLLNLCRELPRLGSNSLELRNPWDCVPIVEQQFIDYTLHMRGTPDLILEYPYEKKAIVVEWKTSSETPTKHEEAQVLAYALLEAVRLGYYVNNKGDIIKAVVGRLDSNKVKDFKVLPIIIRPTQGKLLKPHPVLLSLAGVSDDKLKEAFIKFKSLAYDVLLSAEHLTLLLVDQRDFGVPIEETTARIPIKGETREVNLVRHKPRQLHGGVPYKQSKYPCKTKTGKPFCNMLDPCRFYFGRGFGAKEDYERVMWGLRFKVFREKERMLLIYRTLYELFKWYGTDEVRKKLVEGEPLQWVIGERLAERESVAPLRMVIKRYGVGGKVDEFIYRVDLLDKLSISSEEEFILKGIRRIREFEKELFYVVSEGKPVLLTPCDGPTPTLSISLFGRVDKVEVHDDSMEYEIGLPSKLLKYQFLIYREYLRANPSIYGQNIFMFEVNVDLTQMDLSSIDALQRALKSESTDLHQEVEELGKISEEEIEREINLLENIRSEILAEDSEADDFFKFLKNIITRGVKRG